MKKKKITICIVVIVLLMAGLFFILKPWIENGQNQKKKDEILSAIESGEDSIEIELEEENVELDYYNLLPNNEAITPVPIENTKQDGSMSKLDGLGVIEIECINLRLPVVNGVENSKLKVSIGHLNESEQFGEKGNCILVGHRNYTYGEMFNRLDEVAVGDVIKVTDIDREVFSYKVYEVVIVDPGSERLFECDDNQYKLTLLTCTPVMTATYRLMVMAELEE